jgi:tetratricopeptide (TPR) repeat protein
MSQFYFIVFTYLALYGIPLEGFTQDDVLDEKVRIEILEARVKYFYGVEKLDALLDLSGYYTKLNDRKAIRYARQTVILVEDIFIDEQGQAVTDSSNRLARSYIHLGKAYYANNKFIDAKESFDKANVISQNISFERGISESELYLGKIDSLVQGGQEVKRGFLSKSFKSLELKEMD